MVVVVLTAAGALIALRAYNTTKATAPDVLERALSTIRQQAGVMAALCAAVFSVITALQTGKPPGPPASASVPIFGTRSSTGSVPGQPITG